uniref:Minor structural protein n=1 Tax=Siphoviridae sp. ctwDi18 TaxID=2827970 RepID=A0A8S5TAU8_9CAUD|nr:MAG TPA: minor structural protein [Siphoviridae sp. ctwDi18]
MKNIYEILKSFGLEVPEDKKAEFDKLLNENYKTQAEVNNLNGKLTKAEGERDALQAKYNTDIAQRDTDLADLKQKLADAGTDAETLKNLQTEFDNLKTNYANAQADYQKELNKQAYEFAVKEKTNGLQFTSNSAKKAFLSDALAKNLTMDNGNILGFDDFVNAYKEQDAGAFMAEPIADEPKPPMFGSKSTKKDEPSPKADEPKERPLIW